MNELIQIGETHATRTALLSTVSSAAFAVFIASAPISAVAGESQPTVWLEFGGELDRDVGKMDPYLPPFTPQALQFGLLSPAFVQRQPDQAFGESARIEFDPTGVNWMFAASIRYARAKNKMYEHQELTVPPYITPNGAERQVYRNGYEPQHRTADYTARSSETHAIIDFQAGKDVGVGLFGRGAAQVDIGVRFAQFTALTQLDLRADPNPHFAPVVYVPRLHRDFPNTFYYQSYRNSPSVAHSFNGVGPSLSWNESVNIAGTHGDGMELTFDWGANFAVLFGRQKVKVQHHTSSDRYERVIFHTGNTHVNQYGFASNHYSNLSETGRTRSAVSPNVGALASISFRMPEARVTLGYRADYFFDAMDSGVTTTHSTTRAFHGPFATISVGLGG